MKILTLISIIITTMTKHLQLLRRDAVKPLLAAGLILVFVSLDGCKKEANKPFNSSQVNAPPATVLLAPGVVKVDSTTTLNAALINADSVSVTFKDVAASEKLQTGNILSSGISAIAPLGFLRKINSITRAGQTIVCHTSVARVSDAVVNTSITHTFTSDNLFRNLPNAIAVTALTDHLSRNMAYVSAGVSKTIAFTHNFGAVTLSGSIVFSGTLSMNLTMSGARVTEFKADLVTVKSVTITASNDHSFAGYLSYQLPPIDLPPLEFDAGVPVTFKAQLLLTVGVTCDLSEKISASVTNTATDEIGEAYENSSWLPINNETHSFTSQFPQFAAAAKLDPYAKLTLRLIPFGLTNVALSGNIDLNAQASVPLTVSLTNKTISAIAGFDLDFGVYADLTAFDLFNLKFHKDLPTIVVPIYSKTYTIGGSGATGGTGGTGGTVGNGGTGGTGTGTGGTATGQLIIQNGTNTSFVNTPVNTRANITLPVVNLGNASITISGVSVNPPFSVIPTTATVPANGTINLTLSFAPTSTGYFNSPVTINSNAADPAVTYQTDGTGTPGSNTGSGGSTGGFGATAVPAIGSYGSCLAVTPNAICPSFTDGVIHARATNVNETNHTITFEVANCDGSAFSSPSTLYVYKGLCGGVEVGGVNFPATVYSYQITVNEPDMTGTKSYNIIVQHILNNQFISYDAQAIAITF
jgi:uncharacterized membrane protein YgcG